MEYETVIGLEVHLQLKTKSKAFCACATEFGQEPNSQTCPVCLGFPGSLPVLNQAAFFSALKVGLALNCQVQEYTKFDRKHYYYPDLPKNYQISQYDLPLARDGFLDISVENRQKRIGILRVHLEEDAGKLVHEERLSYVDFNRTGVPLLEIVSQPEISSPQEAYEYLTTLKSAIEYLEVSGCDMEKGSLRCDANISLRKKGAQKLGRKTELKNMNSFKAIKDALSFEVIRQTEILAAGEPIVQETRLWDAKVAKTISMRSKEEAKDYRYFPEPDLPPFIINRDKIEEIRRTIPELPREKMLRWMREYELSEYDAKILVSNKGDADYAESAIKTYPQKDKKPIANWLIGPFASIATDRNCSIAALKLSQEALIELIAFVENQQISQLAAKSVLAEMIETGRSAAQIIQEKNLVQISDTAELEKIAEEVIKVNPKSVQDYKSGKANALMFLVGQAMKKTQGKANPKIVQELFKEAIEKLKF